MRAQDGVPRLGVGDQVQLVGEPAIDQLAELGGGGGRSGDDASQRFRGALEAGGERLQQLALGVGRPEQQLRRCADGYAEGDQCDAPEADLERPRRCPEGRRSR